MPERLIEIEDARGRVLEAVRPLEREPVPVREALGRVLAEEIEAPDAVPGFDNSAMDGYAVRAAETVGAGSGAPRLLRVSGESRAGHPAEVALGAGEAIAISTGAMVPVDADAVIRVEDTAAAGGEPGAAAAPGEEVGVLAEVEPGSNIRRAGEDLEAGERVLAAGTPIGPAEIGVLVSAGRAEAVCARRPRVSVVVTGDELIGPEDEMRPGAVRDSNAYTVPALAAAEGAEVFSVEHVGDQPEATREALGRALESDLAIVCGGISVGEHDHVRDAFTGLGVEESFWGVALRPGKPTWFGSLPGGALAFGLPGNPVSAMVTFLLFARPALAAMQGADPAARRGRALIAEDCVKKPGRAHAIRVAIEAGPGGLTATPTGAQGSHVLTSMLGADALAMIPAASKGVAAGEAVEIELLPRSTMLA
jgi:molybdopterin molybdotransferase